MKTANHSTIDAVFSRRDGHGNLAHYGIEASGFILVVTLNGGDLGYASDELITVTLEFPGRPEVPQPFEWPGRESGERTDMQYNRARHYDPAVGRWLADEPLGYDVGEAHLYPWPVLERE